MCFYSGYNFTGTKRVYQNPFWKVCTATPIKALSVMNEDDQEWLMHSDGDCTRYINTVKPRGAIGNLSPGAMSWD